MRTQDEGPYRGFAQDIQHVAYDMFTVFESRARRMPISERLRAFRAAQWWDAEELGRYRDRRVAALVAHAYATVPYYRRRMDDAGLRPEHVARVADLSRLPVLTRTEVHAHAAAMVSDAVAPDALLKSSSSGSTGEPVHFVQQRTAVAAGFAMERLGWGMAGWRAGDRAVLVWGHPATVTEEWARPGARAKAAVFRELRLPGYDIGTPDAADAALERIEAFRPLWMRGYASALRYLAARALDRGRSFSSCRGVLPTAEMTTPDARHVMERAFGPVFDGYGSSEVPGVAYQCRESGLYHVMDPHVVMEFGDEAYGESGARDVILTNLDEYGMPFIRYRIGDMAVPSDEACPCGRHWSTLSAIHGRKSGMLTTSQGAVLLVPSVLGHVTRDFPAIERYQVAKTATDTLEIRVVGSPRFDAPALRALEDALRPMLGDEWRFAAVACDTLPLTPGGKHVIVVDETSADGSAAAPAS